MDVSYTGQNLEYLSRIPKERVNYLHASMIRHLPDDKIAHVTRPDLVRVIPKSKLFYIHPRVSPLLTAEQKEWANENVKQVADLPQEQIKLLLCPCFVRQVPEMKLSEVSNAGREFVFRPTKIQCFTKPFSHSFSRLQRYGRR